VAIDYISQSMVRILGAFRLLALAKPLSGIWLIAMDDAFYQLVSRA